MCAWVYSFLYICGPVALYAQVYPLLFICGPTSFVHVSFFPFYIFMDPRRCARGFILFYIFVDPRRCARGFIPFCLFVGPQFLCTWVFSPSIYLWAHDVVRVVYPLFFICGSTAFMHVGFFPFYIFVGQRRCARGFIHFCLFVFE